MKCLLSVSLATLAVVANFVASNVGQSPALQKGVSVQMAVTSNAAVMPEADNQDAWIVAITADGKLYFGIDPISPSELADKMKSLPRRHDQQLYIKADARTPFTNVETVLEAGREVEFAAPVLLTAQPMSPAPGTVMPPNGLEVLVGPPPAGTVATVVQVRNVGQGQPELSVNGDKTSWSALKDTLTRHFQKGDAKVIVLKSDERLPFGQVVQVIDTCRATGAQVVLHEAEL